MPTRVLQQTPVTVLVRELEARGFLLKWEQGATSALGRLVLEGPEQQLSQDVTSTALSQLPDRP